MFEKLKKLIFDESIELEPQEEEEYLFTNDSLENNKNLIRTQPIQKQSPQVEPEVVSPEVVENVFKRIDVTAAQEVHVEPEVIKPVEAPKKEVVVKKVKPIRQAPKPVSKNPQYYKPRPVISPMFGVPNSELVRNTQIESLTKPEAKTEDDKIISPMYGVVTSEQEIVTTKSKPSARRRKAPAVNMSLEEMLNMQSSDELEFTLFDVKVDKKEFQSRENQVINDSDDH